MQLNDKQLNDIRSKEIRSNEKRFDSTSVFRSVQQVQVNFQLQKKNSTSYLLNIFFKCIKITVNILKSGCCFKTVKYFFYKSYNNQIRVVPDFWPAGYSAFFISGIRPDIGFICRISGWPDTGYLVAVYTKLQIL